MTILRGEPEYQRMIRRSSARNEGRSEVWRAEGILERIIEHRCQGGSFRSLTTGTGGRLDRDGGGVVGIRRCSFV